LVKTDQKKKYGNGKRSGERLSDSTAGKLLGALNKLREWDPAWAEQASKMATNPWSDGVLPAKFIELVLIGLDRE